jgi:hypothetical protein
VSELLHVEVSGLAAEQIRVAEAWWRTNRPKAPNAIREELEAFRKTGPDAERARGYWNEPIQVPTLRGSQIVEGLRFLGRAASGIPELLLRAPVRVDDRFTLWVFSDDDMGVVTTLQHAWAGVRVRGYLMDGYGKPLRDHARPAAPFPRDHALFL